ncbi:MAG TPA: PAS domain S-box protein, partial [Rubricoccaceae bacterium]
SLRETILFAPHSLLKDPPFSHVDLVTCRNLLIYFQRDLQQRALELFHYALEPGGYLFLGTSETTEVAEGAFHTVDKANRIYQRREGALARVPAVVRGVRGRASRAAVDEPDGGPPPTASYAEVHRRLRADVAPPSVLVTETNEVAHLSEGAGPFFELGGGELTRNVVRLVRSELRVAVQTALFQASRQSEVVTTGPARLDIGGAPHDVRLRVQAATGGALFQVLFDAVPAVPEPGAGGEDGPSDDTRLAALMAEHAATREQLQISIEEFETNREELQAQNEELQSTNEELRSTAEELETSKEEAQSMAEELLTVNDEMKASIEELARSKGDLENLIVSTEIATLFLDRQLSIKWFTPQVRALFHVRTSDVGRPLADLAQRFGDLRLVEDAEAVLDRLQVTEREVQGENGRWYLVHVRPYRTVTDHIDGVVVTFVDITERRRHEEALRESEAAAHAEAGRSALRAALADALRPLSDPGEVKSAATRLLGEHLGASRVHYGEVEDDAFVVVDRDYTDGSASLAGRLRMEDFDPALARAHAASGVVVATDVANDPDLSEPDRAAYAAVGVAAQVCAPLVKGDRLVAVLAVHQNEPRAWTAEEVALVEETAERTWAAVERARAEAALRFSEVQRRLLVESARDFAIYTMDLDRRVTTWSPGAEAVFGYTESEAIGQSGDLIFVPEDRAAGAPEAEAAQALAEGRAPDVRWHLRKDGSRVFIDGVNTPLVGPEGPEGFVKVGRDLTAKHAAEAALRVSEERFRTLVQNVRDYAIFRLDLDGFVTEWTVGAERVKGYTEEEAVGLHLSAFVLPEDVAAGKVEDEIAEARATGRAEREGWRVRKGGELFWANEVATAIYDGAGT